MDLLEPVVVENKKLLDAIKDIVIEEASDFIEKAIEPYNYGSDADVIREGIQEIVQKSIHTGIEYALWKFAASLDKSRSIPEPGICLEALKRVTKNG